MIIGFAEVATVAAVAHLLTGEQVLLRKIDLDCVF
jgi:hypothetical protein